MKRTILPGVLLAFSLLVSGCGSGSMETLPGTYWQDDFSNPESGWDRISGADGVTDYEFGAYRMFAALPNYYMWSTTGKYYVPDVAIQVTVTKRSGPDDNLFGVICRYRDSANYYILMISSDGMSGLAKVVNNEGPFPLDGGGIGPSRGINTGNASNLIRAECIGNTIRLIVNGEVLLAAEDYTFTGGGDAGLWLNTREMPGVDLTFDDFSVLKP